MAVPKRRQSKSVTRMRRSHDALNPIYGTECSNAACRKAILSHRVCPHCGFYRGKSVVSVAANAD